MNYTKITCSLFAGLICLLASENMRGNQNMSNRKHSNSTNSPNVLNQYNNLNNINPQPQALINNNNLNNIDPQPQAPINEAPKLTHDAILWQHAQSIKKTKGSSLESLNRIIDRFKMYKESPSLETLAPLENAPTTFENKLDLCIKQDTTDSKRYAMTKRLNQLLTRVDELDMDAALKETLKKMISERLNNPHLTHSAVLGFIGNHYYKAALMGLATMALAYTCYSYFQSNETKQMAENWWQWIQHNSASIEKSAPYAKVKNVVVPFCEKFGLFSNKTGGLAGIKNINLHLVA